MSRSRRKAIPDRIKLIVALRKLGLTIEQVQFDHNPALALRSFDEAAGDTIPPANDPDHIDLLLITEHKAKTFGKGGEKRITTAGSDIGNIKKVRHLIADQEAFRRRLLAKDEGEPAPARTKGRPKARWPKRPFPRREKQ